MKKIALSLALAALLMVGMVAPAMASGNDQWVALLDKTVTSIDQLTAENGRLTVVGTAAVAVEPDMATVMLGISLEDASVKAAQDRADQTMLAIINAVKALGVPENKIVTSNYSVFPAYDYSQEPARLRAYQVSNTITVEVAEFGLISQVVDKATEAGANQVQSITFDISRRSEVYRQALQNAIGVAREKAAIMATAAGKQLGELKEMTEAEQNTSAYLNAYDTRIEGAKATTQILGGELNVTAQVTLVFNMQ